MKVLVTGADGFIGSHLCEVLVNRGYDVRGLVQYNSFHHWGCLEDSDYTKDIEIVYGDVRDPYCTRKIANKVDAIYHLAALIAIPYSYAAPASYIDTNVHGTLNICQAALECGVDKVIHTSTSEVYGTAKYTPIDETHPLQAQSPYSASKIAADALALSYYNAFELPVTIARPFNTYGPRQSARAIIPTLITQIAKGYSEIRVGDTKPTRDFSYVEDTCKGIISLGECPEAIGETVNIGSNFEISIGKLLNLIGNIMGRDVRFVTDKERMRPTNSEVYRLWCDNSKIQQLTGFEPATELGSGLKKTIEWFSQPRNLNKYKPDIYHV